MLIDTVFEKEGLLFRVIHVKDGAVYYYPLWNSMRIFSEEKEPFIRNLDSENYRILPDPCVPDTVSEPSKTALSRRERDYKRMNGFWESHKDDIVIPSEKVRLLKELAEESGVSFNTLRSHLDLYLKGSGFTGREDSMLRKFSNCGNPGIPKTYRPGRDSASPAIPSYYMEEIFSHYCSKIKKKGPNGKPLEKHIKSAFDKMKLELFTDSEGNVDDFCPSLSQLYKWGQNRSSRAARLREQLGEHEYHKNHRQLTGSATDTAQGPNFTWEIDCSTVDVEIVDKYDRERPIGCPKIIMIKDVFSRMCIVAHIFIGNDSWLQEVEAMVKAARLKTELAAEVGLSIDRDQWSVDGILPNTIRTDRGPFTSSNCKLLARHFGVKVEFTGAGDPTGKGTVERSFKTLHDWAEALLPGCKHFDTVPRGEKDPVMEAKLTLPELTNIIYSLIVEHNNTEHEGFSLTPEMIRAGVNRVPAEIYRYGMKNHLGQFKRYDPDMIWSRLLPQDTRTIRKEGIRFDNRFYVAGNPADTAYLSDHRGEKAKISYSDDTGYILLWREDGTPMELVGKGFYKTYSGVSAGEAEAYARQDKENRKKAEPGWNKTRRQTREHIKSVVDSVEGPVEKAGRRKNAVRKRENRKAAIEQERKENRKVFTPVPEEAPKREAAEDIDSILDEIFED